jgi:hypothetical protein
VRGTVVVQWLVILAVAAGLGYAVTKSADDWSDWVVFGVIVCAALGGAIAVWNRQYPAMSKKRRFTRDSDSEW